MPEHESWPDRTALRRFEADLYYAESPFDLYNAFVTYMERQFDIPEEAAMKLQWHAQEAGELPSAATYEASPEAAHEQTRLALIRIALPFAEALIDDDEVFKNWLHGTATAAMGVESSPHQIDHCVLNGNGLGCEVRQICPVRTVKYTLVREVTSPDFDSPDYSGPWGPKKVRRTLAKLELAERLGLSVPLETDALRKSYVFRSRTRGIILPEESDI